MGRRSRRKQSAAAMPATASVRRPRAVPPADDVIDLEGEEASSSINRARNGLKSDLRDVLRRYARNASGRFSLDFGHFDEEHLEMIRHELAINERIEELDLRSLVLGQKGISLIADVIIRHSGFKGLALQMVSGTGGVGALLDALSTTNSVLTSLYWEMDMDDTETALFQMTLQNLTSLERLHINRWCPDEWIEISSLVSTLNSLVHLTVENVEISLRSPLPISHLKTLALVNCHLDDTELIRLATALQQMHCLESLEIKEYHRIFGSGFARLIDVLKESQTVKELSLDNHELKKNCESLQLISDLMGASTTIQTMKLKRALPACDFDQMLLIDWFSQATSGKVQPHYVAFFTSFLPNMSITSIDISNHGLGSDAKAALVNALRLGRLRELYAQRCKIGEEDMPGLATALAQNSRLLTLDLSLNLVGDAGATEISRALLDNTTLQYLDLSSTMMSELGARELFKAIRINTSLQTVNLSRNRFDGSSIGTIDGMHLANLDLSFNRLDDIFVLDLCRLLETQSFMRCLNLSHTDMSSLCAVRMARMLESNTTLAQLDLRNNDFDTASLLTILDAVQNNRGLVRLDISRGGTKTTDLERLLEASAACSRPALLPSGHESCVLAPLDFANSLDNLAGLAAEIRKLRASYVDIRELPDMAGWHWMVDRPHAGLNQAPTVRQASRAVKSSVALVMAQQEPVDDHRNRYNKLQTRIRSGHFDDLNAICLSRDLTRRQLIKCISGTLQLHQGLLVEVDDSIGNLDSWSIQARKAMEEEGYGLDDDMSLCDTLDDDMSPCDTFYLDTPNDNIGHIIDAAFGALEKWRCKHDAGPLFTKTNEAFSNLISVQSGMLTCMLLDESKNDTELPDWQEAARALLEAIAAERRCLASDANSTRPTDEVPSAIQALLNNAHAAFAAKDHMERFVAQLTTELQLLQMSPTPPKLDKIKQLQIENAELVDHIEMTRLKIRGARRTQSAELPDLERALADAIDHQQNSRFGKLIAEERARLYRIADELYPELLLPGTDFAVQVGIDGHDLDHEAQRCGLVLENTTLDNFQELSALTRDRRVLKVADSANKLWVLKRFHLGTTDHSRQFYRQVALLHRLRDPHIMAINGVFQDGSSAYVQMPYYAGGDLDAWLNANPAGGRDLSFMRNVLADVLRGVKFLHKQELVHGDLKPSNILLSGNRAVLSDFDGVRDINTTITVGGTIAYWAPEIRSGSSTKFTTATDIYALGLISRAMLERTSVPDSEWRSIVDQMTEESADDRPSAAECLAMPFVAHGAPDVELCGICFELVEVIKGLKCQKDHFLCQTCLGGYLGSLTEQDQLMGRLAQHGGGAPCFESGCTSQPLTAQQLAPVASKEAFDGYMDAVKRLVEKRTVDELERQLQERMEAFQREGIQNFTAKRHIDHIVDEILTLRCPRCRAPFYDFNDGDCFALKCPCRTQFCGYCLADCGADAHQHVICCPHNTVGGLFHPDGARGFHQVQRTRRQRLVRDYWRHDIATLEEAIRNDIAERLRPVLADFEIDVDQLRAGN